MWRCCPEFNFEFVEQPSQRHSRFRTPARHRNLHNFQIVSGNSRISFYQIFEGGYKIRAVDVNLAVSFAAFRKPSASNPSRALLRFGKAVCGQHGNEEKRYASHIGTNPAARAPSFPGHEEAGTGERFLTLIYRRRAQAETPSKIGRVPMK